VASAAPDPTLDIIAHLSRRDMEKALAACDAIQASTARITAIVAEAKRELAAFKRELDVLREQVERR
jgi:hypothetical protein